MRIQKKHFLLVVSSVVLVFFLAACNAQLQQSGTFAQIPAGKAYAEEKEVYFIHTEASDERIAETLTNMMKSPVLYVPSFSKIPRESTARVFVFENGIKGDGPLGFQADVFDYPPNRSEYTPLRRIVLVKWINVNDAILLKAADSILMAEQEGSVMLLETNTIVNMPFVVWENGRR